MGLRERRQVQHYQTTVIPEVRAELQRLAGGAEIAIEIDWSTFENSAEALDQLEHQALGRVVDAVRRICIDDLGREAVRAGLKVVAIIDVPTVAEKGISFADGRLEVQGAYGTGDSAGMPQDSEIQHLLEDAL